LARDANAANPSDDMGTRVVVDVMSIGSSVVLANSLQARWFQSKRLPRTTLCSGI
jgi:hypothetical protein